MTTAEAIRQLDECGFAWALQAGRIRSNTPMYSVWLYPRGDDGVILTTDAGFSIAGDNIPFCVTRAMAWIEQQERRRRAGGAS